ncbi:MAG: Os1348 family NHLP clan protein [Anaerolineales bacterium]|jgi:hypothetical protein
MMIEHDDQSSRYSLLPFLAGKVFLDAEFRERFMENPRAVARQFDLQLTDSQVENIKSLNQAQIDEWVAQFEGYTGQTIMAMSAW